MKSVNFLIPLLALVITAPCPAMDRPRLLQVPAEILEKILTYVVQDDPHAIGNLSKIKVVSRQLERFLSTDEMRWILCLDQGSLNLRFAQAIRDTNPTEFSLLMKLGPLFDREDIIEYAIISPIDNIKEKDKIANLLTIISILEQAGASWKNIDKASYLLRAAINHGEPILVKLLLEHGMSSQSPENLTSAIDQNNPDIVRLLLLHKAVASSQHLFYATKVIKNPKIVSLLLETGLNANQIDQFGQSPLLYAIINQDIPMVALLLDHGANPISACLETAISKDNITIIDLLLAYGAQQPTLKLISNAVHQENPMPLIEVLKIRYPDQMAFVIGITLMAGAQYIKAVCSIL